MVAVFSIRTSEDAVKAKIVAMLFVVFSLAIKFRQPVKGCIQRIIALGKVDSL